MMKIKFISNLGDRFSLWMPPLNLRWETSFLQMKNTKNKSNEPYLMMNQMLLDPSTFLVKKIFGSFKMVVGFIS